MTLQPHQQRVVDEYKDLYDKTIKLGGFLRSSAFVKLDETEQARLTRQWQVMQEYGLILNARMDAFTHGDSA